LSKVRAQIQGDLTDVSFIFQNQFFFIWIFWLLACGLKYIFLLKKPGDWWCLRVSLVRNLINMIFQAKLWALKLVHSCSRNWANQSFLLNICQAHFIWTCWYLKLEAVHIHKSKFLVEKYFPCGPKYPLHSAMYQFQIYLAHIVC
jgi:hypothetical protein